MPTDPQPGWAVTAGLILAAGAGRRFGRGPKQLAELGGKPLLQWAIDAQCSVDPAVLYPIVLVLGACAQAVAAKIDPGRARVAICSDWDAGQAASLHCGLAELRLDAGEAVLVTLGDAPLITPAVIARFAAEPPPARAVYDGHPGHPVVLGPAEVNALSDNRGDRGARSVLGGVRAVEVAHLCSGRDVDTREDLEEIRRQLT